MAYEVREESGFPHGLCSIIEPLLFVQAMSAAQGKQPVETVTIHTTMGTCKAIQSQDYNQTHLITGGPDELVGQIALVCEEVWQIKTRPLVPHWLTLSTNSYFMDPDLSALKLQVDQQCETLGIECEGFAMQAALFGALGIKKDSPLRKGESL